MDSVKQGFSLKGHDEAFSVRRESIFGSLPVVVLKHNETLSLEASVTIEEDRDTSDDTSVYKGEESMFKRPMPKLRTSSYLPRKFCKVKRIATPDHKQNPHKWVRYNLSTTSEITEKSNSAAAFSFLRELEERKRKLEPTENSHDYSDSTDKILFKKPNTSKELSDKTKTYRDGKLCMPTFEFGSPKGEGHSKREKRIPKKDKSDTKDRTQTLLTHLQNIEDDSD